MYSYVYSPQDTHVDHLRNLIDQRSTRADIRGRFSTISEYSDTPSVYSRPFFSPKSSDNDEYQNDQDCPSPTSTFQSYIDQPNDNTQTMHNSDDFDYDPRSSIAPSEIPNIDDTGYEGGDRNSTARMSYLGPKMRFHSRAPWELEDNALEEEAEPEEDHRYFQSVFPFRGNGAKSATSSSPRPSYTTNRPSGESSRSQVPPKRSFETINSQISYPRGALYTLAQESLSSHSLGRSTSPNQKETLRSKFSLGRLRSDVSNVDLSPGRSPLNGRFPRDNDPFAASIEPPIRTTTSYTAKGNSVKIEDNVHPYANPDLVVSCIVDRPHSPFRAPPNGQQRASDEANITPSESCTTDLISSPLARSTLIMDTAVTSAFPKHRVSSIQAKNISSPVSLIGAPHRIETPSADNRPEQNSNSVSPGINNLPGWTDPNGAPAFSLISLEEARAQRMRSATANPTPVISCAGGMSKSNPPPAFPPTETEAVPGANSSHVSGSTTRARARSISVGANKARNALQTIVGQPKPERRDSEPTIVAPQPNGANLPGKVLKHKKSGFMRLFNAGKVPENDGRETPPPVPFLPDSHSANHVQPVVQRTPKSSVHRIPVPSLSPPSFESSSVQSSETFANDTWKQSTKRLPPRLSINTQPAVVGIASASVIDDHQSQAQASPPFILDRPRQSDQPLLSAPANLSEVPSLKLRPVSTLFSAHFGDHIVITESSDIGPATPRSSPREVTSTPVSAIRASHEQLSIVSPLDDQGSLVRSLQEQLVTAKKAWQMHVWELEGQVRELKATVEELKGSDSKDYCQSCGRGKEIAIATPHSGSVVHRPRARTGTSSRFTNALP